MLAAPRQIDSSLSATGLASEPALTGSFYGELYEMAGNLMKRERPDCSLQSTILVHDAYMALQRQRNLRASNRPRLLAAAAKIMRRTLVDCARARRRKKRGGDKTIEVMPPAIIDNADTIDVLELHQALDALKKRCAASASIVEMKFFGGMTHAEIAQVTGLCERTVGDKWRFARAWLYRVMNP